MMISNCQHRQHSELVLVQNNILYDDNDDDDVSYQQRVQHKFNGKNSNVVSNEDEAIYEPTIQTFSFEFNEENISMMQQYATYQTSHTSKQSMQNTLSKPIIDLGKKLLTTSIEQDSSMKMILLFRFHATPNQFNL